MKIVITGAGGLVGGRVLDLMAEHDVWAITRTAHRPERDRVRWLTADLAADRLPDELPDHAEAVIHLAQSPHYRDFPDQALDVFNVNVGSTARLLDWSRRAGVKHFILASSGGVGAVTAQNFYLASRQGAELLAAGYQNVFDVLVLRFFFVYGPGQDVGMLVPRLIESVAAGRPIPLASPHGTSLNPVHVDDAAHAVIRAVETRAGGTIDIAGPGTVTIREMAETVAARLHRTASFTLDATRRADRLIGDIARMSEVLRAPRVHFADGLGDMLPPGRREGRS
jgi:nucleoside-diphosphate-sugar epimerase